MLYKGCLTKKSPKIDNNQKIFFEGSRMSMISVYSYIHKHYNIIGNIQSYLILKVSTEMEKSSARSYTKIFRLLIIE